ncbi:MAG: fatty acid desaturase, partial [Betaproteobacteria bacterium]
LFGWQGVVFFLAQSFVAVTELEIVNYIEHYGLHRRLLPNGRWERIAPEHSWNAPWLLSNLFILQLQRHSDHHAEARRRYSALRHHEDVPTLPAGYAPLMLLALVPPLWFRVMNPRVRAWYSDDPAALAA